MTWTSTVTTEVAAPLSVEERNAQTARLALTTWAGTARGEAAEAIAAAVYAPTFESLGPARSERPAGGGAPRSRLAAAFSDRTLEVERVSAEARRVVSYVRFRGRHTGQYEGHRPTGETRTGRGYVIHEIGADGRIVKEWAVLRWA